MTDARNRNADQAAADRQPLENLGAQETGRSMSAAPSPEGNDRPEGDRPDLSARDLQTNQGQDELNTTPGSDADQANQVPHVG